MDEEGNAVNVESIETGEYYQAARSWYSDLFHRPIAERSYYLIVITLSLINCYFALVSFAEIFPIRTKVPFIVYSEDVWKDLPRIIPIAPEKGENNNTAMMKFLLSNYVDDYEGFDSDPKHYELRYRSVAADSAPDVFAKYYSLMDASNHYAPYNVYGKDNRRVVTVNSVAYEKDAEMEHAHIVFHASVISNADNREISHSKWQADIAYRYTDFVVDQSLDKHAALARFFGLTGEGSKASGERRKVVQMTFKVYDYQRKELLE